MAADSRTLVGAARGIALFVREDAVGDGVFVFLLLALTALLYGQFLDSPVVFDDLNVMTGDPGQYVGASAFFSPRGLGYFTIGLTHVLFGPQLVAHRIVSLLLHAAVAVLLMFFLRRLLAAAGPTRPEAALSAGWLAFFAALLFALHPVAVYGAGYLAQRTTVMATLFALACWLSFLKGATEEKTPWLAASVAFYFLSVLSKEHAVMVPAPALALAALLPGGLERTLRRHWGTFAGFAAVGVWLVLTVRGAIGHVIEPMGEELMSLAALWDAEFSPAQMWPLSILTQSTLFFKYLLLWLLPDTAWMSVDMREPVALRLVSWPYLAGATGFLAYGAAALWLLFRRGSAGLLGFVMLCPWMLFATEIAGIRIQEPFVLYRSYLWMAGAFAAVPLLFRLWPARAAAGVLAAIAVLFTVLAWDRLLSFSDSLLLWDDAIALAESRERAPYAYRLYNNRGNAFLRLKMPEAAIADYDRALALRPRSYATLNNRGVALLDLQRHGEALRSFSAAIALAPQAPPSYVGRARTLRAMGGADEAEKDYRAGCALGLRVACEELRAWRPQRGERP